MSDHLIDVAPISSAEQRLRELVMDFPSVIMAVRVWMHA